MKKHLLLVSTLAISLMSAQSNDALKREFERQNKENNAKFDSYVAKRYGADKSPEVLKEIEEQKANLAGFYLNQPFFYQLDDTRQVSNSNADVLNAGGSIAGLTGTFNGEGIKYTVFDGGRAAETHTAFNNTTNNVARINNKEASTEPYSDHATGVSGFIGSKSVALSSGTPPLPVGNTKGVAINSIMDNYRFASTTLPAPNNNAPSTVFDKILIAQPKISNHSYGVNAGWTETYNTTGVSAYYWQGYIQNGLIFDLNGTYWSNDYNYDNIVYNNPSYIIVKSSGNYFGMGPNATASTVPKYYRNSAGSFVPFTSTATLPTDNCALGYDCIGPGSLAKNIIVVGATDIITSNNFKYTQASDVIRSDYSSTGPRDDGGIKPDISTVGTNVYYPSTDTSGASLWAGGSGTSFSAPVVTGIIGLWTQINKQLFNNAELNAASAKTLMIHSALEAGNIGPDAWFGWGFIDAKKGAELLVAKSNNSIIFADETLTSGVANSKTIKASGSEPLKVTISWIDPQFDYPDEFISDIYNNRSSRLVNDLDLRIIDTTTNTVYQPWKLDANSPMTPAIKGDNTVDNVEQVVLDSPVAGRTYRIEITNKGTLVNNAATPVLTPQNYSIIVTGFSEVLGTKDVANTTNGIVIAPTLTKDIVNILKAPKKSNFTVYDLSGKKLQSGVINSAQEVVSLSSYTNGIYIIEVKTDKDVISKKVIKE
ncbi:S8 family peptidase [Chryseobacterium indoltheticum]|uniref:S8 family peptidase n=1 Tax=Chryseobacterium indoltheticum TaxID=254 RepID=UPI001911FFE1|nr:S8 family peptidase [Chryseobacterium indoltheticum]QQQ29727.1 S8 family peptidase [Chryseobacterium indoltheticum]